MGIVVLYDCDRALCSAKESRYDGLIATYLWIYVRQVLLFRSLN